MRISYKWLLNYIDLNASIDELSLKLTSLGLEVEAVEIQGKGLEGFWVGEVLDVQKHPNADRLTVCNVLIKPSEPPFQIVCGAPTTLESELVMVTASADVVLFGR